MTLVGTTVGRIRIVDTLGKGGMGEVYAGYDETLKRKVAVKAIRDERRLDTEAKARFLREARILSQLDHPGICRIHEYIEGDDSDFLVLELIAGRSLKQALEEETLEPSAQLFIAERVAEALVAAHAKGVAHRDLKPENVMLTDEGEVKVLDFGLAHSVDGQLATALAADKRPTEPTEPAEPSAEDRGGTDTTTAWTDTVEMPSTARPTAPAATGTDPWFRTQHGIIMGTVTYMSPEQARGEHVTAAGDMYSFGLLLQELFTGRSAYPPDLPFPQLLLLAAGGQTLPATGLDPDLEALIVRLKTPSPEGRPSSAETAERLRWIRGKPARRLLRRLAAGVLAALLLGGLKYTFDLRRERALANQARIEAEAARREAEEARLEAERVSELLVGLFATSDPEKAQGRTITALELLDAGADKIDELRGQPSRQARLMLTMGRVYRQLGVYERAVPLLEGASRIQRRQLGDDALETASTLDHLASLYHDLAQHERAEPLFRQALRIREKALGAEHPHVAASLNNLAFHYQARGEPEAAEPLLRRALEIQEAAFGTEHPDVATGLNNLGELYRSLGDLPRAEAFLRRATQVQESILGTDHPDLAASLNNFAMVYHEQGDAARAEPLFRRALAIYEKVLGAEHPSVATNLNNLAELHRRTGGYAQAEPLYRRAAAIQQAALGEDHPSVAITLSNLADLHSARGEAERAAPLYERALAIQQAALGADHPSVAVTLNHRADLLAAHGDAAAAEPLYRRALAIQQRAFGEGHPSVAITLADLAGLLTRRGHHDEAEGLFRRSLESLEGRLAESPGNRSLLGIQAAARLDLGTLHHARGDAERAAELWAAAEAALRPFTAGSEAVAELHTHALALLYLGRLDEARPLVDQLLAKGWADPELLRLCRRHGLPAAA